jgi:hypothetical protein
VHTEDVARTMSAGLCINASTLEYLLHGSGLIGLPRTLSRSASSIGHASLYGKVLELQRRPYSAVGAYNGVFTESSKAPTLFLFLDHAFAFLDICWPTLCSGRMWCFWRLMSLHCETVPH